MSFREMANWEDLVHDYVRDADRTYRQVFRDDEGVPAHGLDELGEALRRVPWPGGREVSRTGAARTRA